MNTFTISDVHASREIPNHPFALAVAGTLQSHFAYSMPDKVGVVAAGQAVSSAILELLGLGDAPFRDLDLFWMSGEDVKHPQNTGVMQYGEMRTNYHGEEVTLTKASRSIKTVGGVREVSVYQEPSFGELMHETVIMDDYAILNTFSDAQNASLNHILVGIRHDDDRRVRNAQQIINAFDINCCQAAFIPETMTLVVTDQFLAFLETLTLSIVSFNTVMHSGIRLEKKIADMPFANVDMDAEIKRLQTYRKMMMLIENKRRERLPDGCYWPIYGNAFSDIYRKRFLNTSERLQGAFELTGHTFCFENTYFGKSKAGDDVSFQTKEDVRLFFLEPVSFDEDFVETAPLILDTLSISASPVMLASYIPLIHLLTDKPSLKEPYLALVNIEESALYPEDAGAAAMLTEKVKQLVVKEPTINAGHFNESIQSIKQIMSLIVSNNGIAPTVILLYVSKLLGVIDSLSDFYMLPTVLSALFESDLGRALAQRDVSVYVKFTSFPKESELATWVDDIRRSVIAGLERDLTDIPAFPNHLPNILEHVNEKLAGEATVRAIEKPSDMVEKHLTSFDITTLKGLLAVFDVTMPDGKVLLAKVTAPYQYSRSAASCSFVTSFDFSGYEDASNVIKLISDAVRDQSRAIILKSTYPKREKPFFSDLSQYPYPIAFDDINAGSDGFAFLDDIPF